MATPGQLLKVSMFIKKNPTMTDDEFHKYWTETHGPIVAGWLARHGVVRYVQYHTHKDTRALTQKMWPNMGRSSILDFDGQVELVVPDVQCIKNALADPYHAEVVRWDDEKLIDVANSVVTVGWEEDFVLDGKVLER